MKKCLLFLSAITFSLLFIFSCSEDRGFDYGSIVGVWDVYEMGKSGSWEDMPKGNMYLKFNNDGSFHAKFNICHYHGMWRLEGHLIKCYIPGMTLVLEIKSFNPKDAVFEVHELGLPYFTIRATKR